MMSIDDAILERCRFFFERCADPAQPLVGSIIVAHALGEVRDAIKELTETQRDFMTRLEAPMLNPPPE